MPPQEPPKKPKKKPTVKAPKVRIPKISMPTSKIAWLLVLVLAAACVFMYTQYRTAQDKIESVRTGQSAQSKDVIKNVSKLVILPANETPTVATVTDIQKLKGQAFFADAKNGDKVLVYNQQRKAILYRPSTNQIVNINVVTAAQNQNTNPTN